MLPLLDAVEMELLGVFGAQFQEGQFVSPLGNAKGNAVYFYVGQEGNNHFLREGPELVFDFADEGRQHGGLLLFNLAAEAQVQALDNSAPANAEEVTKGLGAVKDEGKDIGIGVGGLCDDALGVVLLQAAELLLVLLRLLEGQALGGIGHQRLVMADDLPAASAQDVYNLLDVGGILLFGDVANTGSFASAYMEIEAGTKLVPQDGLGGNLEVAGTKRVHVPEEINEIPGVHDAAVRSKVTVSFLYAAGDEHLWEVVTGDADPGICLGILEKDVVLGLVLLDEVVLQEKGIGLRVHYRELGIGYLAHEDAGLGIEPLRGNKILRDALVKVFCLAHVYHFSLGVVVTVYAGRMREQGYFLFDCHHFGMTKIHKFREVQKALLPVSVSFLRKMY